MLNLEDEDFFKEYKARKKRRTKTDYFLPFEKSR